LGHHYAIWASDFIVQMLIDNGASIDEVCEHSISPLEIAKLNEHKEIMNLPLLKGAKSKRIHPYQLTTKLSFCVH
jgi:ankyrin repeat protein